MDTVEARAHLEIADRILAQTNRRLRVGGEFFVIWGLASAVIDAVFQLVVSGKLPQSALWIGAGAIAVGIIFSVIQGIRLGRTAESKTAAQRQYLNVLWISLGMAFIAQMFSINLFTDWNRSALWTFSGAIVLLYLGSLGNRNAVIGGLILVASLIVANFTPNIIGYVLAAGMLIGYAGFGVVTLALRTDNG